MNSTLQVSGKTPVFWTGEEPSFREQLKLKVMHQTARVGGVLGRVLGRRARNTFGVLTYHRIAPHIAETVEPTINVRPARFRRQLLGLKRRGFKFWTLSAVLDAIDRYRRVPERLVAVTFDDIFDNVYSNAWPVLRELQIPATFFVSTQYVDTDEPFPFDPWARKNSSAIPRDAWLPIQDVHLREMLDSNLIELGAHTHSHQDFRQDIPGLRQDVEYSLRVLAERYGVRHPSFAFPYGSCRLGFCSDAMTDVIRQSGIRCALTTDSRVNQFGADRFAWGRFHVFDEDTPLTLGAKLDGWYEWAPLLKRRLFG